MRRTEHDLSASEAHRGHALAAGALVVAVGLIGAWLGMLLLARNTVAMGPFRVELDAGFGRGETRVGLPPFGALLADTHLAPLGLSATLRDIGVQELTDAVNRVGVEGLAAALERDAREEIPAMAIRVLMSGTVGALILAVLAFRTRWRRIAVAGVVGMAGVGACELAAVATFETAAFQQPRYSGSLALAPKFIGPVGEASDRIGDLRAGLEQIVDGTVRAYTSLQSAPLGTTRSGSCTSRICMLRRSGSTSRRTWHAGSMWTWSSTPATPRHSRRRSRT